MPFTIKSWQAFVIGLVMIEGNAILKATCLESFPFAEVNVILTWLLGFYLVKRVAQRSPKLGGKSNETDSKTP